MVGVPTRTLHAVMNTGSRQFDLLPRGLPPAVPLFISADLQLPTIQRRLAMRDPPHVIVGINHCGGTISVEHIGRQHIGLRTVLHGLVVGAIHVRHEDIESAGARMLARLDQGVDLWWPHHQQRVADTDLGMLDMSIQLHDALDHDTTEGVMQEVDQRLDLLTVR